VFFAYYRHPICLPFYSRLHGSVNSDSCKTRLSYLVIIYDVLKSTALLKRACFDLSLNNLGFGYRHRFQHLGPHTYVSKFIKRVKISNC